MRRVAGQKKLWRRGKPECRKRACGNKIRLKLDGLRIVDAEKYAFLVDTVRRQSEENAALEYRIKNLTWEVSSMHMAPSMKDWLDQNAQYCNRYSVRMTPQVCAANQKESDDLRCVGCSGLEDSYREIERPLPAADASEPEREVESTDALSMALATALQEVMDGGPAVEDDPVDDFEDEEETPPPRPIAKACVDNRDPLMRLLLVELQKTMEDEPQETDLVPARTLNRRSKQYKDPRPVRVYIGRCQKCGGYMVLAAFERCDGKEDREVYRCFNCGWRISPAYDYNRKHSGDGEK